MVVRLDVGDDETALSEMKERAMEVLAQYGLSLILMAIVLLSLYLYIFNGLTEDDICVAAPGYSCENAMLFANGTFMMSVLQSTGSTIYINAISCSSRTNSSGYPEYGNAGLAPSGNSGAYVNGAMLSTDNNNPSSVAIPSGSVFNMLFHCYNSQGMVGAGHFVGNVWLNYSLSPNGGPHLVVQITNAFAKDNETRDTDG